MAEVPEKSNSPAQPFVVADHIHKEFGNQTVLDRVSLEIMPGELIAILGPSGCGKTTLLRIIAGLEKQNSGRVIIGNQDVSTAPPAARRCGIVFQSYALFPNLSAGQNIAFGMDRGMSRSERQTRVRELLELIGLPGIEEKYPAKLSGGQQQRVALARALAVNPSILLLDEPLSALDAKVRTRLRGEIRQIQQRLGVTTLLVTHDQEEAMTMADRVVVMDHGRILQVGTPFEIYRKPSHSMVADFVGSMNVLTGWSTEGHHRLVRDGHFLHHEYPVTLQGAPMSVAFRPEDARVVPKSLDQPPNCLTATVQRVEFRGSFCRVYLTAAVDSSQIVVDAPVADADDLIKGEAREVSVHLPTQYVRVFRQDGSAA